MENIESVTKQQQFPKLYENGFIAIVYDFHHLSSSTNTKHYLLIFNYTLLPVIKESRAGK